MSTNHELSPPAAPAGLGRLPPAGLARFRKPRPQRPMGEQCEMCAEPIGDEHRHVVNLASRAVLCACTGCYLLFTAPGAAQGKYRAIPDRYRYDPSFALPDAQWDELQIPVRMAFMFFNSTLDRWVTFYPSPAGATESLLPLDTWREVLVNNPALADTTPDVEALLLRRDASGFECYQVPIDACYQLAGLVKLRWKGFDGGQEAWDEINEFFAGLRARSQVVSDE